MSLTSKPIVGIDKDTNAIVPISMVLNTGLKCNCLCFDCNAPLEAVLNTTRKKHFRHSNKSNCSPSPETQLHLLAKHIILNSQSMYVPNKGFLNYINPVAEVKLDDLIPDVIIEHEGSEIYIEVIVTNPINQGKLAKYEKDKAVVLQINLSEEDRNLAYDDLAHLVLEERSNKSMLEYTVVPFNLNNKEKSSIFSVIFGILLLVLFWLGLKSSRPQKQIVGSKSGRSKWYKS